VEVVKLFSGVDRRAIGKEEVVPVLVPLGAPEGDLCHSRGPLLLLLLLYC